MKRYVKRYANDKEGCRGTITQRNVFEAADTTYLVGVFDKRPLKKGPLPAVMNLRSMKRRVNGKEGA